MELTSRPGPGRLFFVNITIEKVACKQIFGIIRVTVRFVR